MPSQTQPLIRIEDLRIVFPSDDGMVHAVREVSFSIPAGGTVGLVGESGCGKSLTGLSLLRLIPPPGRIDAGHIWYCRKDAPVVDLTALPPDGDAIRSIRGREIAMIFQEPMSSLNPVYTIGAQIGEMVRLHQSASRKEARERSIEMLGRVGIPSPEQRVDEYPHQLSGGMRQRAMIAMALSCNPSLLIADEPTTALDVTVQAQILDLMRGPQQEMGMAILIISHDLGVIADLADEVVVMYAGRVVERAPVEDLFYHPLHPYTRGLLQAAPVMGTLSQERLYSIPGTVPSPFTMPRGCAFRPRCPERLERCLEAPRLTDPLPDHQVRCWARELETVASPDAAAV